MSGGKRPGAGRKYGSGTLPPRYWLAIVQIVDEVCREQELNVSDACDAICREGGIKWVVIDPYSSRNNDALKMFKQGLRFSYDPDVRAIATINKAPILRNRYYRARNEVAAVWGMPPKQPPVPRRGFQVYCYTDRGRLGRHR
jgi:hypothetical protein